MKLRVGGDVVAEEHLREWYRDHLVHQESWISDIASALEDWLNDEEYISVQTSGSTGKPCLLYTSPSPRDRTRSRMPSSA